jgi:hypothetical protein
MRFPVITVKEGIFSFKRSEEELRQGTKTAFERGWFKGLTIIDADGFLFVVEEATNSHDTGRKLFRGLFSPSLIEVRLKISAGRCLAVDEVLRILHRALALGRETWESADLDYTGLRAQIDGAQSLEQIWEVITPLLTGPIDEINK